MNPSFEDMWASSSNVSRIENLVQSFSLTQQLQQAESEEQNDKIFASMQPYRVPFATKGGCDAQMAKAFKKAHAWNVSEATQEMEMISTKTICRKCLLHTKVCRTYGLNLQKHEAELQMARSRESPRTVTK